MIRFLAGMLAAPALFGAASAAAAPWAHDWNARGRIALDYPSERFAAGAGGHVLVGNGRGAMAMFDATGAQRWASTAIGAIDYGFDFQSTHLGQMHVDDDGSAWYTTQGSSAGQDAATVLVRVDADGRVRWSRPGTGSRLVRTGTGAIVAGCGNDYRASVVSKVDAEGALVWQRTLPRATCGNLAIASAYDGGAYVLQYDTSGFPFGAAVMRLDAYGTPLPQRANGTWSGAYPQIVAEAGALYLIGSQTQRLDPVALTTQWSAPYCMPLGVVPAPVAGAGDLVCWRDTSLMRLDATTGEPRWSVPGYFGRAAVSADAVWAADGLSLQRIDVATGAVLSTAMLPDSGAGDYVVGVGLPASNGVGVVLSSYAPDAGIGTAAYVRATSGGSVSALARVETAPLNLAGNVRRDGDDLVSAAIDDDGDAPALRVRIAAALDGAARWEAVLGFGPGMYPHHVSPVAVGADFVAVAASWSVSRSAYDDVASGTDLVVLARAGGAVRWRQRIVEFDTPELRGGPVGLVADADGGLVVSVAHATRWTGTLENAVRLLRYAAADGALRWRGELAFTNQASQLWRAADAVFAVASVSVARIGTADGSGWSVSRPATPNIAPIALPGGDIVVVGYVGGSTVVARLALATGQVVWERFYADGARNTSAGAVTRSTNGEVVVVGVSRETGSGNPSRPFVLRLDAANGSVRGAETPSAGVHSASYGAVAAGPNGTLQVIESRRSRNALTNGATWLTDLDAAGRPVARRGLRPTSFGNAARRAFDVPFGASSNGEIVLGGMIFGGEVGQGISTRRIDLATRATGDLAVTLDPLPQLRTGRPFAFAANVAYDGDVPTAATLYLRLPWSGAPAPPTCTGVAPADCAIDTRNGWYLVDLRLAPGARVRVAGTQVAGEAEAAYLFRTVPLIEAAVIGETGLRETSVDNNLDGATRPVGLFADGFD